MSMSLHGYISSGRACAIGRLEYDVLVSKAHGLWFIQFLLGLRVFVRLSCPEFFVRVTCT